MFAVHHDMRDTMSVTSKAVPSTRIHISGSSQPSQYLYKATPPRPPCWQDFIGKSLHTTHSKSKLDSHVSITLTTTQDSTDKKDKKSEKEKKSSSHRSKQRKSTSLKAGKASTATFTSQTKLKRTRSEPCISEKEIPAEAVHARLTASQLKKQSIDEAKRYLEDTYNKCTRWLAQISPGASIPLEDTDFEVGSGDIITCSDETRGNQDLDFIQKRHSCALDKIPE